MRIFTAVRHSNDPKRFYGGLWSANFYPALREMGHDIIESQTDLLPASRFMDVAASLTPEELNVRAERTERILDEVRAAQRQSPVDLFLSYFYNAHFEPGGFDDLRRLGIPSVNFYCNSVHQFGHVAAIAPKVDFSWHAERDAGPAYQAVGANPVWVQMGADPSVYHPISGVTRQTKTCFVGQRYADRDRWAVTLLKAGIPVDLYGAGWGREAVEKSEASEPELYLGRMQMRPGSLRSYKHVILREMCANGFAPAVVRLFRQWHHRSVTRRLNPLLGRAARGLARTVTETFAGYEAVVNFSNVWADGRPGSRLIPHVRLRDFEAPMSRSCYLTGHTEEIENFYAVGHEIDTYRTADELVDKARFYLQHPAAAESLREAGYRRALRDHTWTRRFEELFSKIGVRTLT